MRDAVVNAEFQHLRVDHDHPAFFGRQLIQQGQDHGVDRDGLTGTRGTGDQQVRHFREVGDNRLAADVFAQRKGQLHVAVAEIASRDDFAQHNLFAVLVREFDADDSAARNGRDAGRQGGHGPGYVVS